MLKNIVKYTMATAICFCVAFVYFQFFTTPFYTSSAVVYPTSTLNPQYLLEGGLRFGDEKELNELIEILKSNEVLTTTYKIVEKKDSVTETELRLLRKKVQVERGVNRSAEISVQHENPNQAAHFANTMIKAAHQHLTQMTSANIYSQLKVVTATMDRKNSEVNLLRDTLQFLETKGEAKVVGITIQRSARYRYYESRFEAEIKKLNELKNHKEHIEGILQKGVPDFYVVNKALVPEKPSYPKPLTYAVLFAGFSVLLLLAIERRDLLFSFLKS